MQTNDDRETNEACATEKTRATARKTAASQISACFFRGYPDWGRQDVLDILAEIERDATELIAPHQKRLGAFDLDTFVFGRIADAVSKVHVIEGRRQLSLHDKEQILAEIKLGCK